MERTEQETPPDRRAIHAARTQEREHQIEAEKHELLTKLMLGMGLVGFTALLVEALRRDSSIEVHLPLLGLAACAAALAPWRRILRLEWRGAAPRGYLGWCAKLAIIGGAVFLVHALRAADGWLALVSALLVAAGAGIWIGWPVVALLWYAGGASVAIAVAVGLWDSDREGAAGLSSLGRLSGAAFCWTMIVMVLADVRAWSAGAAEKRRGEAQ